MNPIIFPLVTQVGLIFAVWLWMYYTRLSAIYVKRVRVQDLADAAKFDEQLGHVVNPSDSFENQFELPVLFFVACFLILWLNRTQTFDIALAWAFVASRAVHSLIHCTYNRIMHRFSAYLIGAVALWWLWIRITIEVLSLHHLL